MAVLPQMPSGGTRLIDSNMREASTHGAGRNMALPQTYYWFYQQVKNRGPWDYKQQRRDLANFDNFNYGAAGFTRSYALRVWTRSLRQKRHELTYPTQRLLTWL